MFKVFLHRLWVNKYNLSYAIDRRPNMQVLSYNALSTYWSSPLLEVNLLIFLNLSGSLILGLILGYERSFHGRAAGMRTYGLVCLASTALIIIVGYPEYWFGSNKTYHNNANVTHVIQGIVTGIGFLGAGVIIREGFTITGLSTAASIWSASAIGVLVGVGFYFAAILLTFLSSIIMMWGFKLESWLPSHHALSISLVFKAGIEPKINIFEQIFLDCDYSLAKRSINIQVLGETEKWHFHAISLNKKPCHSIIEVSDALRKINGIESYQVAYTRS